jgi:hypothetical protein
VIGARAVAALLVVVGSACADSQNSEIHSELTGVVLSVEARSITNVVSFTLTSEDRRYRVFIDPDVRYDFAPGHLREHVLSGEPVRVEVEERDGRLFATALSDA